MNEIPGSSNMDRHNHTTVKNIKAAFLLNLIFAVLELVGGLLINSVAILSDALHDLGDSVSLGLAWILERVSTRESNRDYPYGYGRFSLLSAVINALVLVLGSYIIISESIQRLLAPEPARPAGMIAFAVLGILVNGAAFLRLKGEGSQNARVVGWHLLEDVLGWILVLIGGILLMFIDLPIIDPLLALLLSLYVLYNVLRNLGETIGLFLQRTPRNVDLDLVRETLSSCDQVLSSHDTRIWSLDGQHHVLTTHLVIAEDAGKDEILQIKRDCKESLYQALHLSHITIEVEYPDEACQEGGSSS